MLCVDANILLRCLLKDDPIQTPKALSFLQRSLASKEDVYVPDVVIMETVWVLQKLHPKNSGQLFSALESLVMDDRIRFDHRGRLQRALALCSLHGVSIVDAYLAAAVDGEPGSQLVTFDKELKKISASPYPL